MKKVDYILKVACALLVIFFATSSVNQLSVQMSAQENATSLSIVEVIRVTKIDRYLFFAVSVKNPTVQELPLTAQTAAIHLNDDRELSVTDFVMSFIPSNLAKSSAIRIHVHPGSKLNRLGETTIAQGAEFGGVNIDIAPLFRGTHFLDQELYIEMLFEVPDARESDVASVRVLNLPLASIPSKAVVPFKLPPSTITFDNQSSEAVLVRLIGPTRNTFYISENSCETVHAASGRYYLKLRYGGGRYFRGDPFVVKQEGLSYSEISITLHKVPGGEYHMTPISSEEFEKD